MNAGLTRAVSDIARDVLEAFASAPLHDDTDASASDEAKLSCSVMIYGCWNGVVTVRATAGLVERVAMHMFAAAQDDEPLEQRAREALRELANIVAGNIKPLLGAGNSLGLPVDASDRVSQVAAAAMTAASVSLSFGELEVYLVEDVRS